MEFSGSLSFTTEAALKNDLGRYHENEDSYKNCCYWFVHFEFGLVQKDYTS